MTSGGRPGGDAGSPGDDDDTGGGFGIELMGGFRGSGDGVTARFGRAQAAILRDLMGQVTQLMTGEQPPPGDAGPAAGQPPGQGSGQPPGWPAADSVIDPGDLEALTGLTGSQSRQRPDDPVLARLLPDAYREDPEASAEFRRYTESGLRSEKAAAARTVLDTLPAQGGRVRLSGEQAQAWLRALNDVRLALGTRLEVTEDFETQMRQRAATDPNAPYIAIYQWLGIVQETLVEALS